jgi:hypothetical protein
MNGPKLLFEKERKCFDAARQSCHSYIVQHYVG